MADDSSCIDGAGIPLCWCGNYVSGFIDGQCMLMTMSLMSVVL